MPILNYTTKIDADKTASEIARCLSMHGAQAVLTEYDKKDGYILAISFRLELEGSTIAFRLPCDWKPVLKILENDRKVPRSAANQLQAVRTQSGQWRWQCKHDMKIFARPSVSSSPASLARTLI
jgi:hypothetical protein